MVRLTRRNTFRAKLFMRHCDTRKPRAPFYSGTTEFMKIAISGIIVTLLSLSRPAGAVLLDCDVNAERIYTCVEIGTSVGDTAPGDNSETYGEEYRRYVEQAEQVCVYNEPRRRVAGKNTGGALRVEELKSARADYEQCISETARGMWRKNKPPATAKP